MSEEKLNKILKAYFNNSIAPDECAELLKYLNEGDEDTASLAIDVTLSEFKKGVVYTDAQSKDVFTRIISDSRFKTTSTRKIFKPNYNWLKYAAVIVFFLSTIAYLAINLINKSAVNKSEKIAISPLPVIDTTKVVLTTSNGAAIELSALENGLVTVAGNTKVNKSHEMLSYENTNTLFTKEAVFHTLSVPRGITYRLQLSDGTNVWLNSASTLSYSSEFLGKERKVFLTGEAYFEVAKNKNQPFLVESNGNTIEVLGTHFNVSAYKDDEFVKTTLLEGSVKVFNKSTSSILAPREQALVRSNQANILVKKVDVEEVMAWKNGYFIFDDIDIHSIMKELVRWYNIEVEYEGEITNQKFGGTFSKKKNISELLKFLETLGDVNFKIEGRKVIVMP